MFNEEKNLELKVSSNKDNYLINSNSTYAKKSRLIAGIIETMIDDCTDFTDLRNNTRRIIFYTMNRISNQDMSFDEAVYYMKVRMNNMFQCKYRKHFIDSFEFVIDETDLIDKINIVYVYTFVSYMYEEKAKFLLDVISDILNELSNTVELTNDKTYSIKKDDNLKKLIDYINTYHHSIKSNHFGYSVYSQFYDRITLKEELRKS